MTKTQLKAEWQDILDLSVHNQSLKLWLDARDIAFVAGVSIDGYTKAIRNEYRRIMREACGAALSGN